MIYYWMMILTIFIAGIICEWNVQNGKLLSQYDLLYPNYTPVCPIRINSSDIALDEPVNAVLKLDMMYELEWDKDIFIF